MSTAAATTPAAVPQQLLPVLSAKGTSFPTYFRQGLPLTAPRARAAAFEPGSLVLKAGSVRRDGAKPLTCDIQLDRDVAIVLRDGTTIYADVFRPVAAGHYPALMAWSPYGKEYGGTRLDDFPYRAGVPLGATSELERFEGPDPAYWVGQGYAVVNPDARGAYNSEGNVYFWGPQEALDGYDVVEWIAAQPWSNSKVGLTGNSWLTVAQWHIAALRPPHLAAIAPWEGLTDTYREASTRGGIPSPDFPEAVLESLATNGLLENMPRMIVEYPLLNDYWVGKAACLDQIQVPAYVVASYTNAAHTAGSFAGYRQIASAEKWLRVHNSHEWPDYYAPQSVFDLTRFFDYYLKGEPNGWEQTPPVRLSVLDPGGHDIINRVEQEFPLARTQYQRLYLNAATRQLVADAVPTAASVAYASESAAPEVAFTLPITQDIELSGYPKLRLWVEAEGSDDMDLAVKIEKLSAEGTPYIGTPLSLLAVTGQLRVSLRELDESRSTEAEPYHRFTRPQPLRAGEIVPVDISLWPMGMLFHAGETLRLTVGAYQSHPIPLAFGSGQIAVPQGCFTYQPGDKVAQIIIGGHADQVANEQDVVATPPTHNKGTHRLHAGGQYDSYLYLPVIPQV